MPRRVDAGVAGRLLLQDAPLLGVAVPLEQVLGREGALAVCNVFVEATIQDLSGELTGAPTMRAGVQRSVGDPLQQAIVAVGQEKVLEPLLHRVTASLLTGMNTALPEPAASARRRSEGVDIFPECLHGEIDHLPDH